MNIRMIVAMSGLILTLTGLAMLFPAMLCFLSEDGDWKVFGILGIFGMIAGIMLYLQEGIREENVKPREAYLMVTSAWVTASLYGSLPYLATGTMKRFSDAFFESVSGFTTTGATVLSDIEALSQGVLLWRAMTHWLGGLGIISLFVALMSFLGQGSQQIFLREATGPLKEKLAPKVKETAWILWRIYIVMTAAEVLLLRLFDMSWFDAVCHAFSTVATGGFSTKNASVGYYTNPGVQWVIAVFMLLGGVNFALFYQAFQKRSLSVFWKSSEFRLYGAIFGVGALIVGVCLWATGFEPHAAMRDGAFHVIAAITTTGFVTVDYNLWTPAVQMLLLILMLVGGSSGSTAGGMKVGRVQLLFTQTRLETRQSLHTRAILSAKIDQKPVSHETMLRVLTFVALYGLIVAVGTLVMSLFGMDLVSAVTAVITCVANAGPGLSRVGPTENFSFVPALGKFMLTFIMLLGRLELYTVLVLFTPDFWSKK